MPKGPRGAEIDFEKLDRYDKQNMRDHTLREKAKITAGAVTALVIVAWLLVIAMALLLSV